MSRTTADQHQAWVRVAETRSIPLPPAPPVPGECCERGCDPCVWDYYERALERWRERHGIARPV